MSEMGSNISIKKCNNQKETQVPIVSQKHALHAWSDVKSPDRNNSSCKRHGLILNAVPNERNIILWLSEVSRHGIVIIGISVHTRAVILIIGTGRTPGAIVYITARRTVSNCVKVASIEQVVFIAIVDVVSNGSDKSDTILEFKCL